MENTELDMLLVKNRLRFSWSQFMSTWKLIDMTNRGTIQGQEGKHAETMEAAQSAAILFMQTISPPGDKYLEATSELGALLSKHRLTFNWGNPGLRWWLVGQKKGSNALERSIPRPAKDIETAQVDAVQFIRERFE